MTAKQKQTAAATEARKLATGARYTRPLRFTLNTQEADELEALSKADRDEAIKLGLQALKRKEKKAKSKPAT